MKLLQHNIYIYIYIYIYDIKYTISVPLTSEMMATPLGFTDEMRMTIACD